MVLGRKQFDSIDGFADFDERAESSSGAGSSNTSPENSLSWRRVLIERAAANVKKAFENKTDVHTSYKKGTLVYDEKANRFARVHDSRSGVLTLSLFSGEKLVRQDIDQLNFVKLNRKKLTLPEIAKKLFLSEVEVISLLNQIELEEENPPKNGKAQATKNKIISKKQIHPIKKLTSRTFISSELSKNNNSKTMVKIAAKTRRKPLKKEISSHEGVPISPFSKLLPKGATTDPVVDPNGYIQQNFLLMSNKELALATGLSEHTIRRKLGEWRLKRKGYIKKA